MNDVKKLGWLIVIISFFLLCCFVTLSFAETTEVVNYPYFRKGASPFGTVFYVVGDLVALPFRLLGDLFDNMA